VERGLTVCCKNDPKALKKMLAEWKPGTVRTYWKVYIPKSFICCLESSIRGALVRCAGVVRSNSHRRSPCKIHREIARGIHVFLYLDYAQVTAYAFGEVAVPVRCHREHLLAVEGDNWDKNIATAVFRQVEITPRAFRKAVGERK